MATTVLVSRQRSETAVAAHRHHLIILTVVFILTSPLVNPLIHGDGVGYYAYLRAPLIQHDLQFEPDWRHGNLAFVRNRTNLRPISSHQRDISTICSPWGPRFCGRRSF
jgi:hypothetical protein